MRHRPFALLLLPALLILGLAAAHAGDELAIGAKGPDFNLKATDGKMYTLASVAGPKGTAVVFTCNACPYSQGYEARLIDLGRKYQAEGVGFIAINPNDPKVQPADSFDNMVQRASEKGFPYPYAFDATQATAAAYGARVTPHVFLLDADGTLVYRGRVDDALDTKEVKSHDFQNALDALVAGKPIPTAETKAFGCGVKWSRKQG
jgi:peroxiredoxin